MNIARIVVPAVIAFFGLAGCSSSTKSEVAQDPGAEGTGDTAAAGAPDVNPDGVPYPTTDIGPSPRGKARGNTIANYKFLGYPDGDVSKGLQPMSMANFFDPTGSKYKMIQIQASGYWCAVCKAEASSLGALRQALADRKVAWVITLAEGAASVPSTKTDLDKWIAEFKAPVPHVLDPGNRNLGIFYDRTALPGHITIDARTMEITQVYTGAKGTSAKDILAEVDKALGELK